MTLRRIILALLILIFGTFIFFRLIKAGDMNQESIDNSHYIRDGKFDKEDSTLFSTTVLSDMKSEFVLRSTYRNDIKCIQYKDLGSLYYTKLDLKNDIPINQLITFQNEITTTTTMHTYHSLKNQTYEFLILGEKTPEIESVIFSLTGTDSLMQKHVYNDNLLSYNLPVSTFSLRYGEDSPIDIFFGGNEFSAGKRLKYPIMISLYKVGRTLYVILFVSMYNDKNLENEILGRIINGNMD